MYKYIICEIDKGVCLPTVMLWLLFLYIEAAVRLRDLRHMPFHLDLCRPFAAHWYIFFSYIYFYILHIFIIYLYININI